MARTDTFQLSVISPERAILETPATFVVLPAHDGEIGVLAHRAPLLVRLGVGWLRADTPEGKRRLLVDGGFAQVVGDKVTVLTEHAQQPGEIDPEAARQALAAARALPITDDASFAARQRALALARAQLRAKAD
jgi:F-type H+-transporting ATPase subunit epsilon